MDATQRIEQALNHAISHGETPECPPLLAAALRYAVFPGGARVRPKLCLAVARACAEDDPLITDAAAAAIELLHCSSLVHDDLPCFDDAPMRRGKPSVHAAFGERLAVLSGDALIIMAFETLARGGARQPQRLAELIRVVAQGVGMPTGIAAGQAWECESKVDLSHYQRAKTGALFAAATMAGAAASGADPEPWRALGDRIGEAYQVADDILDVTANSEEIGKPVGRDAALGRPSAAKELGMQGATDRLKSLVAETVDAIPPCPGAEELRTVFIKEAEQFLPKSLVMRAA